MTAQTAELTPSRGLRISAEAMGALADDYFRNLDVRPWNRFSDVPWDDLQPEALTGDEASVLKFITYIEDHLPSYFLEYQRLFPVEPDMPVEDFVHNRELYRFSVKWAQEEEAHAHVLYHYQLRTGMADADELRSKLAEEGKKPFRLMRDPAGVFTYTLIQEKATQIFYQNFERAIEEPVLKHILRHLTRDEARHFAFFSRVFKAYIEEYEEDVIPVIHDVVENFRMPLSDTLRGYWRWSIAISDAIGGYDHSEAYEHLARVLRGHRVSESKPGKELLELIADVRARA